MYWNSMLLCICIGIQCTVHVHLYSVHLCMCTVLILSACALILNPQCMCIESLCTCVCAPPCFILEISSPYEVCSFIKGFYLSRSSKRPAKFSTRTPRFHAHQYPAHRGDFWGLKKIFFSICIYKHTVRSFCVSL